MIILCGASATGKTEIGKLLDYKYNVKKVITYTTRAKRINERDGIDYNFISAKEFEEKIKEGFFFEYTSYNDNYYGTAIKDLCGDKYVIVEPNGLKKYLDSNIDKKTFYLYCDAQTRRNRMKIRGDKEESIDKRIEIDLKAFDDEYLKSVVDSAIDVSHLSLEEISKIVYEMSKQDE